MAGHLVAVVVVGESFLLLNFLANRFGVGVWEYGYWVQGGVWSYME